MAERTRASDSRTGVWILLRAGMEAVRRRTEPGILLDPDVVTFVARVSVWGRWSFWVFGVFLMAYDPVAWYPHNAEYLAVHVLLGLHNGLVHHRLLTKRPVTWRWMFSLCALDVAAITAGVVIFGGFGTLVFLSYYPAMAVFAVVFSSFWLSLAWVTGAAGAYVVACLAGGSGLDIEAGNDSGLAARVMVMYNIAMGISFITRFERARWRAAAAREGQLRRERIELSQTIHDTTAQTAYMIGLGIYRARELAGESNEDLVAVLDATSALSRSAIWEMRGPIDAGHIVEGRELEQVLWSHCAAFEKITGIRAGMAQSGTEPPLAAATRNRLFSIAHNALTNAYLHASPRAIEVRLHFEPGEIILSVSDDGVGLPDSYDERGRGFKGMRSDAALMGGTLIVESGGGGTTITCVIPRDGDEG